MKHLSVPKNWQIGKRKTIIICLLIIAGICIVIAAYVAYGAYVAAYFKITKPIKPVQNYTLHANPYLQKHGLKKESFNESIQVIYLDDFLDYSTDKDCGNHNQVKYF